MEAVSRAHLNRAHLASRAHVAQTSADTSLPTVAHTADTLLLRSNSRVATHIYGWGYRIASKEKVSAVSAVSAGARS